MYNTNISDPTIEPCDTPFDLQLQLVKRFQILQQQNKFTKNATNLYRFFSDYTYIQENGKKVELTSVTIVKLPSSSVYSLSLTWRNTRK